MSYLTGTPKYRAKNYGIKSDGMKLTDVTVTANSNVVTSASYQFQQSDVGKNIGIVNSFPVTYATGGGVNGPGTGGYGGGTPYNGVIQSVSGGAATIYSQGSPLNATTGVAGTAYCIFGTDDTAAINTLCQQINTIGLATGKGGTITFEGITIIGSTGVTITGLSYVQYEGVDKFSTAICWVPSTHISTIGMFTFGTAPSYLTPWVNVGWSKLELDMTFSWVTSYSVPQKILQGQYFRGFYVKDCWLHDSTATGLGTDYIQQGLIENNIVVNCGRTAPTGTSLGGAGMGIGTATATTTPFIDDIIITGNHVYMPKTATGNYGIFFETQFTVSTDSNIICSNNILYIYSASQKALGISGADNVQLTNNKVYGNLATSQVGISVDYGTVAGIVSASARALIANNSLFNTAIGISLNFAGASEAVALKPILLSDNYLYGSGQNAILIATGATIQVDSVKINGGLIYSSLAAGISVTGTAGLKNLSLGNIKAFGNATTTGTAAQQAALSITAPINGLNMSGCDFYDDGGGTQLYGIIVSGVAVTNANIQNNNLSGNVTGSIGLLASGTIAGWVANNKGYNPVGPTSVTLAASPATYTAGNTQETLYVTSTTVTAAKNSITLPNPIGQVSVNLDPGESVVLTYTGTPTAVTDRH